jgi:hypothetical protein
MAQVTQSDIQWIVQAHDTHYQTVYNLSNYMLDYLQILNFSNSVTVGECMGDPPTNWYRIAGGAANQSLLVSRLSRLRDLRAWI